MRVQLVFAIIQNFTFFLIITDICFVTGSLRKVNFQVAIVLRARFVIKLLDEVSFLSFKLSCFECSVSYNSSFVIQSSPLPVL